MSPRLETHSSKRRDAIVIGSGMGSPTPRLPWAAAFLAGKVFVSYRRNRGAASAPLPDFFIGAHAAVDELALLTRDARRYRTYFPTVQLLAPESRYRPAE